MTIYLNVCCLHMEYPDSSKRKEALPEELNARLCIGRNLSAAIQEIIGTCS
ncbi:MAG: hypothetical protein ACLPX5_04280 [Dissulfurispiraceae bacterium]